MGNDRESNEKFEIAESLFNNGGMNDYNYNYSSPVEIDPLSNPLLSQIAFWIKRKREEMKLILQQQEEKEFELHLLVPPQHVQQQQLPTINLTYPMPHNGDYISFVPGLDIYTLPTPPLTPPPPLAPLYSERELPPTPPPPPSSCDNYNYVNVNVNKQSQQSVLHDYDRISNDSITSLINSIDYNIRNNDDGVLFAPIGMESEFFLPELTPTPPPLLHVIMKKQLISSMFMLILMIIIIIIIIHGRQLKTVQN